MYVTKYETRIDDNRFVTLSPIALSTYVPGIENLFGTKDKVYNLCRALNMDSYAEEHVFLLCFDGKNRLQAYFEIGVGNVDTCIIDKRGIAQKALLSNAYYTILVHNHPSGDPTPSEQDCKISNELKQLGELLGIPFADSIVLGDGVCISLSEKGLI